MSGVLVQSDTPHPHTVFQKPVQFDHLIMAQFLALPGDPVKRHEDEKQYRDPPEDITGFIEHPVRQTDNQDDQGGKSDGRIEKNKHGPYRRLWAIQPSQQAAFRRFFNA